MSAVAGGPAITQGALDLALSAIGDVGTFTIAMLPLATLWPRRTAWALDLFNAGNTDPAKGGRVVSEGGFWKPIRPLALAMVPAVAPMTFTAMLSAPTQVITGAIALGTTIVPAFSTLYAYPGARFRTLRKASGTGGLSILGSLLPVNGWTDHEYDPAANAWIQTASGGLL